MRKITKKIITVGMIAVLGVTALTGCGSSKSEEDSKEAKKILVGVFNQYKPYCYLDENGELQGYDVEVLKAIDELLPQYEFEFQPSSDPLSPLQAGKIDISSCQWEYNEERAEQYLFSKEAFTTYVTYIVVKKDRNDINSLEDFVKGKGNKLQDTRGGNTYATLQAFNDEHKDNPLDLELITQAPTNEEIVASFEKNKIDGIIRTDRDVQNINETAGYELLKVVGEPINTSDTYFLFGKQSTELQEAVDGALKELRENGKLSQLSKDIIGADYTPKKESEK